MYEDNSFDYVHLRWLVGTVNDHTELFKQVYRVLKPGGWVESFDLNGILESEDGTVGPKSAHAQWGIFFREGAKKLGISVSFSPVRDNLQVKGIQEAGFTRIEEQPIRASYISPKTLLPAGRATKPGRVLADPDIRVAQGPEAEADGLV